MKNALFTLFTLLSIHSFGQDLTVPDSILKELSTSVFVIEKDTICFKYVFPENYDSTKTYPVMLGLSGGNQSEFIVDYCYASWFKSEYFKEYFTILPVNVLGKNLRSLNDDEIFRMIQAILENFNVTNDSWILSGTSNGGVAGYNFVAHSPKLFHGIITVPGSASDTLTFNQNWSHLHVLNAVGQDDSEGWKSAVLSTSDSLKSKVKVNDLITLKGVGHILPLSFEIDKVYERYFSKTLGMDGKESLNETEINYLEMLHNKDEINLDFSELKVAFISGSGGSRVITKKEYFSNNHDINFSTWLIQLTPKEKVKSGGYDYLITKWVKFQPKKYRKRIIKTLSNDE